MSEDIGLIDDSAFKKALCELIPHLRAFARSLCGDPTQADDLAQDAMLKAWKARESFEPGTNLKAWTFTILRNIFYSEKRRSWRHQPLDPEVAEATLTADSDPAAALELLALKNALWKLPEDQREALMLVGAGGMSYEEASGICGCAVGTVKSRVSRARAALVAMLESNTAGYSDDSKMKANDAFDAILNEADRIAGVSAR